MLKHVKRARGEDWVYETTATSQHVICTMLAEATCLMKYDDANNLKSKLQSGMVRNHAGAQELAKGYTAGQFERFTRVENLCGSMLRCMTADRFETLCALVILRTFRCKHT